jgi:Fe-S-cluster containining protein
MKINKDYKNIGKLAEKKDDENWEFRCFLKAADIETEELDAIVHKLYKKVADQINCRECGICCRVALPVLKTKDITKLSNHLSLSADELKKQYLVKDEREGGFVFPNTPCPFFNDNKEECACSVYSARPDDCCSYPHLHKKNFSSRLIGIVNNCHVCPIVYNVYELLKIEIHNLGIRSYYKGYRYTKP